MKDRPKSIKADTIAREKENLAKMAKEALRKKKFKEAVKCATAECAQ